jgi:hypothetical protein
MNEAVEIVPVVEEVNLGVIHVRAEDVVKRASAVATELAKVINDRKLYASIQSKKYVTVEGWNTLGAMLGVLPMERECHKVENGYEASVDLIRTSDGMKVGGSSAICTRDESKWATRDEYAVRSMAITRATGKAFRLGFSWIMKLAGYEATPAEEIIDAEADVPVIERPAPDKKPVVSDTRRQHSELWNKAMKANLLNKDTIKLWSVTLADTDEQVSAKIALITAALPKETK